MESGGSAGLSPETSAAWLAPAANSSTCAAFGGLKTRPSRNGWISEYPNESDDCARL